jgi:hypothetical protein
VSHRSTATVALNKVKTQAADGLSTATYCDVVTSPSTWHPCGKRRTPVMASRPVARQVGMVASSQSHPRSRSFHWSGNIHAAPCMNLYSAAPRIFAVHCTMAIFFSAPDRVIYGASFSNFHVGSYQSDCTKVVALYTSFDFVTKFLVEYSLDHAKFDHKVHQSSLTIKLQCLIQLSVQLQVHFTPISV